MGLGDEANRRQIHMHPLALLSIKPNDFLYCMVAKWLLIAAATHDHEHMHAAAT